MKMAKKGLLTAAMMAGALAAAPADAATFLFTYSGASFGNAATATGSFDIADSALASVNANATPSYGSVNNLTMTVSGAGAGAGNGVFTTSNFITFFFRSPTALDFTRQLVGQPLAGGVTFGQAGQSGLAGDFAFFGFLPHVPTAATTFTLGADRNLGPRMALTSLIATTAVPEPASWAMLILGVGAIGFALRRGRRSVRVVYAD